MKWPVPTLFLLYGVLDWWTKRASKEHCSHLGIFCILTAIPSALSLLTWDKGSKTRMGIGTRKVRDYPMIPFLWKNPQMGKIRMGPIFPALAVQVLSELRSGLSLHPSKAPVQGGGRMVDKLIAAGGWGMMCVSLLPNSTNLLNKQLERLLCERVSFTMMSLFTGSARSPLAKRGWTRLDIPVLLK